MHWVTLGYQVRSELVKTIMRTCIGDLWCVDVRWRWTVVVLLIGGFSFPAWAALGGGVASVQEDQARMKGTIEVVQKGRYIVYEIRLSTGTVVREYSSLAGTVFGVVWRGPFVPSLRQILGNYFEQYSETAKAQRESRFGRRPLNIREAGLVVQMTGHLRAYSGIAYDPTLLPIGVSVNDLQ